ncbi:phage tail protein [Sphingomonas koreensis]|uniref:phage tail sheath subtilisin-like domain-containing protein n=1 Tax=Sphingomonas koreensis TaxID=93064 RepID=UPI000834E4F1|nr:phage tail sheath subtilisin-like domain-containing protein [Sphingomonas koreensis]PJI89061.1 hypothetical protein BDW16_2367 [Sphingomonas koreensis]RSU63357.1 phage tail protein [Sphingomonas koreensis]RSU71022.1 phage tail protein [Sphingomonas koreensis]
MHSLTIREFAKGRRPIKTPSLAVIGLVATATAAAGTATDALNAAFPIGELTLVTNIDAAISKAGTGGTLAKALAAIADLTTPIVIVSRVAPGAGAEADEETDENVIAGLDLLLSAKGAVGYAPRIIGAPGLDTLAVTTQMVIVAKRLRGFAYARANGDDGVEAMNYRDGFTARELMLIWPNSSTETAGDAVARALGLRAQIDERIGWHKTISNMPIDGVTALDHYVQFDLLDPSTEAGTLNGKQITTIIRANGFRFWGNRTTAGPDQPEFAFESAVRTSHALQDIIADVFQPYFDHPMTVSLIKDLLETANAKFRELALNGFIMGAKAYFDADRNQPEQLSAGRPDFRIEFTPVAPLEDPTVELVITDFYYSGFADRLV